MNKVVAVVMAVICLMSLTCVTAFAAETDLPPGAQLVSNGSTIGSNDWSLETPYVIPAKEVDSITITGLFYFSKIHGWDGTQWVNITSRIGEVKDSVTFSPADYSEYFYFTVTKGDTMASQNFTVAWKEIPKPTFFDYGFSWLEFLVSGGLSVLDMLVSHPVTRLLIAGGLAIGVFAIFKFGVMGVLL